jgi:hypothetical protein
LLSYQNHAMASLIRPLAVDYTPKYAKWLKKNPVLRGVTYRNRTHKINWSTWNGKPWRLEEISQPYRETLWRLARTENAYLLARERLLQTVGYQRGCAEFLLAFKLAELQSQLAIHPFVKLSLEQRAIMWLLKASQGPITALIDWGKWTEHSYSFRQDIENLKHLIQTLSFTRSSQLLASRKWWMMTEKDIRHSRRASLLRQGSLERRSIKTLDNDQDWTVRTEALSAILTKLRKNQSAFAKATNESKSFHQTIASRNPRAFLAEGFHIAVIISQNKMTVLIEDLYKATLFSTGSGLSQKALRSRDRMWAKSRDILDKSRSEFVAPVYEANTDLYALRYYRIEYFGHSITTREIKLARVIFKRARMWSKADPWTHSERGRIKEDVRY